MLAAQRDGQESGAAARFEQVTAMWPLLLPHHPDLLAAVDLVMNKLEMQVRRYKEKIQDRRRTPHAGEVTGAPPAPEVGEE